MIDRTWEPKYYNAASRATVPEVATIQFTGLKTRSEPRNDTPTGATAWPSIPRSIGQQATTEAGWSRGRRCPGEQLVPRDWNAALDSGGDRVPDVSPGTVTPFHSHSRSKCERGAGTVSSRATEGRMLDRWNSWRDSGMNDGIMT